MMIILYRAYEQPQVTTGDTCVSKGDEITLYNVIDTDHEYEGLDKYSKRDGEIKSIPSKGLDSIQETQPPVSEEYECTDYPAYVPVTAKQGGNTESDVAEAIKEEKSCS